LKQINQNDIFSKVVYFEDDDVVHFKTDGHFGFYRCGTKGLNESGTRKQTTLELELSRISKGEYAHYMLKEIFEQEESVLNTVSAILLC